VNREFSERAVPQITDAVRFAGVRVSALKPEISSEGPGMTKGLPFSLW
jgi:hypothetical protein